MNRNYKVVWNRSLGCFTAVAEYAKSRGKSSSGTVSSSSAASSAVASGAKVLRLTAICAGLAASGFSIQANAACDITSFSVNCGSGSNAAGATTVAIGRNAQATGGQSVAIGGVGGGQFTTASGDQSIAVGANVVSAGSSSIAIGGDDLDTASRTNTDGTVLPGGSDTVNLNKGSVTTIFMDISGRPLVNSTNNTTRYPNTASSGAASVAIGVQSVASGALSTAFGTQTKTSGIAASAFGVSADASQDGSVALGAGSSTLTNANNVTDATVNGFTYGGFAGAIGINAGDQVSVGSVGRERQIKSVAAGNVTESSTDAVNGSQLFSVAKANKINYFSVKSTGGTNEDNKGATGDDAIAIGKNSIATGTDSIAIGQDSAATNNFSVSIGKETGKNSIGIRNLSVGYQAGQNITGDSNIALGPNSANNVAGNGNTASGSFAGNRVTGNSNATFGVNSGQDVTGNNNVGLGVSAGRNVTGKNNIASGFGAGNTVFGEDNIALGADSGITIGTAAAPVFNTIAIGRNAKASSNNGIAMGANATALTADAVAIGTGAIAKGGQSVSIGKGNTADGDGAVAIGDPNVATGDGAVAQGKDNIATGSGAIAAGNTNKAVGTGSIALGNNSKANENGAAGDVGAVAIGSAANAKYANSVALGSGSVTGTAVPTAAAYNPGKGTLSGLNPSGEVAVGATTVGTQRRITNLAAGALDTDAVNVSQLKSVAAVANQGLNFTGDNTAVTVNRKLGDKLTVKGGATTDLSDNNIGVVANATDNSLTVKLAKDLTGLTSVATGDSTLNTNGLTITGGPTFTKTAINAAGNKIAGVAAGTVATDAVNFGQLNAANTANAAARTIVAGGTNNTVTPATDKTTNQTTYTVNADGTTVSAGSTAVSVTQGTKNATTNLTDYAVDLSTATKTSLTKADNSVQYDNAAKTLVTLGGTGATTPTKITNVAAGTATTDAVNFGQLTTTNNNVATNTTNINKGLDFTGDNTAVTVNRQLGQKLTVKGGAAATDLTENNIGVVANDTDKSLTVKLAKNLTGLTSVVAGDSTLNTNGLTIINGPSITKANGINAGDKAITNVATGGTTATNAANIGDVNTLIAANKVKYFSVNSTGGTNEDNKGATGQDAIAIGKNASASSDNTVALGSGATGSGVNSVAVGSNSKASGQQSIAIGSVQDNVNDSRTTSALGKQSIAIGANSVSRGASSIAIGGDDLNEASRVNRDGTSATTINDGEINTIFKNLSGQDLVDTNNVFQSTESEGAASIALGVQAKSKALATAVGTRAEANEIASTALGVASKATKESSVALGAGSIANIAGGATGFAPTTASTIDSNAIAATNSTNLGAVSVGTGAAGGNRQIVNVAAGTNNSDAVNVAQLRAVSNVANQGFNISAAGGTKDNVQLGENVDFTSGNTNLTVTNDGNNGIKYTLAENLTLSSVTTGNTKISNTGVTITSPANAANNVVLGSTGLNNGNNKITNVANGNIAAGSKDAVNGGQINTLVNNATNAINNNTTAINNNTTEINKGLNFTGDTGTKVNRALGTTLKVQGGETDTTKLSNNNIGVVANGTDGLLVQLAKNINLGTDGSVTTGDTRLSNTGLTIANGPNDPVSLTNGGLNNGGNQITKLQSGLTDTTLATATGDTLTNATNVGDLKNATTALTETGFTISAASGTRDTVKLGENVDFTNTDGNLVVTNTDNTINYDLANNITVNQVTIGNPAGNNTIITSTANGLDVGGDKITNVAQGDVNATSMDAINGSQLNSTNTQVAGNTTALGGSAAYNPSTGNYTAPTYILNNGNNDAGTTSFNNVGGALTNLDTRTSSNTTEINKGIKFNVNGGERTYALGETIGVTTDDNLITTATADGVNVALNPNLDLGPNGSLTIGNTVTNNDGVTVKDGQNETSLVATGINVDDGTGGNTAAYLATGSTLTDAAGNTNTSLATGNTVNDGNGNVTNYVATGTNITDGANTNNNTATGSSIVDGSGNKNDSTALGNTITDGTNTTDYTANGFTITNGPSVTKAGINAGNTKITNVANGTISDTSTDAINGSQLNDLTNVVAAQKIKYFSVNSTGGTNEDNKGATGTDAIAIGKNASATQSGSLAIGLNAVATGEVSSAVGFNNNALGSNSTAVGNGNTASGVFGAAFGIGNTASGNSSSALGNRNNAGGAASSAVGFGNNAQGDNSSAVGNGNLASGAFSSAFGLANTTAGANSTAVGFRNTVTATGTDSTAVGNGNSVSGANSSVLGNNSSVAGNSSVALGSNAQANANNSVALGSSSVANAQTGTSFLTNVAANANNGTVSVGSDGATRRITNVAGGSADNDGVNVAQLKAQNTLSNQQGEDTADALGGGATYNPTTGAITNPTYVLNDGTNTGGTTSFDNVGGALTNLDTRTTTNTTAVNKGINFGNETSDNNYKLGDTIRVKGDSNVTSTTTADGVQLGLADNIIVNSATANLFNAGRTTINDDGLILGLNGTAPIFTRDSVDVAGNQITRVGSGLNGGTIANATGNTLTNAANVGDLQNATTGLTDAGLNFVGDDGTVIDRDLGQTLRVTGGATTDLTDGNIGVVADGTDGLRVKLAKNLTDLTSVTTGNSVLSTNGLTVADGTNTTNYGANGFTIMGGPSVTKAGIDAGNTKITNVANGTISDTSTDAINGSQLNDLTNVVAAQKIKYFSVNSTGGTNENNKGATGDDAIAIGKNASATGERSSAIGFANNALGNDSSAVGNANTASGAQSSAFGLANVAGGFNSTAVGFRNNASGDDSTAVGESNTASGALSSAVGLVNRALGESSSAFGSRNVAGGAASTAVGFRNNALGSNSVAVGNGNNASGEFGSALGVANNAQGDNSTAVGFRNTASGANSSAFGNSSTATGDRSLALGTGANAVALNSVALGSSSVANAQTGTSFLTNVDANANNGTVSVGTTGQERRITNLAAGSADTDAANVAQLRAQNTLTNQQGEDTASALGGGATYNSTTGAITNPTYTVNGSDKNNVGAAIEALDAGFTLNSNGQNGAPIKAGDTVDIGTADDETNITVTKTGNVVDFALNKNLNLGAAGSVTTGNTTVNNAGVTVNDGAGNATIITAAGTQVTNGADTTTYGANGLTITGGPSITKAGINAGNQKITNVADGTVANGSTDAVNGGQLNDLTNVVAAQKIKYFSVNSTGGTNEDNKGATGTDAIAIGRDTTAAGDTSIALGSGAQASGSSVVAIGNNAGLAATGDNNVYNGFTAGSFANGNENVALGSAAGAGVTGDNNIAIGASSGAGLFTNASNTISLGQSANASKNNAVAIGNQAQASTIGGVALGQDSIANVTGNKVGFAPTSASVADKAAITATNSTNVNLGAVSVGTGSSGGNRQIVNVAAGTNASDAVNVSQLTAVSNVANQGFNITAQGANSDNVKLGETVDFTNTDGDLVATRSADNTITYNLADNIKANQVTIGNPAGDNTVLTSGPNGLDVGGDKITNVAAGSVAAGSTDAINGSQLFGTTTSIKNAIGGETVVNPNGTITTTNVGNTGQNNISDAIQSIGQAATASKTTLTAGNNIELIPTVDPITGATNYKVKTADNLDVVSVKAGNTTLNNDGVTVNDGVGNTSTTTAAGTTVTNTTTGNSSSYNSDGMVAGNTTNGKSTIVNQNGVSFTNTAGNATGPTITAGGINAGNTVISGVTDGILDSDAANVGQLNKIANTVNNGFNVTTAQTGTGTVNGTTVSKVAPGATQTITAGNNISITQNGIDLSIATNPNLIADSVKTGSTTISDNGLNIVNGPSVTKGGINANNTKITNVADGVITAGSQEVINGGQLSGSVGSIKNVIGGNAVVNTGGTITTTNVGGTGKNNIDDAIKSINNATVTAKSTVSAGKNIVVSSATNADGSTNYQVTTADNLDVVSVKTGNTVTNNDGVTVSDKAGNVTKLTAAGTTVTDGINTSNYGATGLTATNGTNSTVVNQAGISFTDNAGKPIGPSLTASGIDAGGQVVTGVADGIKINDAANIGQLTALGNSVGAAINDLGYRINDVEDGANAGVSAAMAMSSLPQSFLPGKSMMGGGIATYNGQSAVAIGVSRVSDNGRWVMKINGTADTQGNAGGSIGAGFHF